MQILLLEDNHFQAEDLVAQLRCTLGPEALKILHIKTERDFQHRLKDITAFSPDVAVLDVMVAWGVPEADAEDDRPEDVKMGGYYTAGVRCAQLLRQAAPNVPIIYYTIVDRKELSHLLEQMPTPVGKDVIVPKSADLSEIVEAVRRAGLPRA